MKFTKEQIAKAAKCKNAEELMALAKAEGIEMAKDEAEKYLAQLSGRSLKLDEVSSVTGGCFTNVCAGDVCANLC